MPPPNPHVTAAASPPISLDEARACGVGPAAVRRLVRAGAAEVLPDGRLVWCPNVEFERRALVGLGRDVVLCLESAAACYDWPLSTELLHLAVPRTRTRVRWPDTEIHCRNLGPADVVQRHGYPLTTPELTIIDLAQWRGLRDALIGLDCARRKRHTNARKMRRPLASRTGLPGSLVAAVALRLSSDLRQSPLESTFRYLTHLGDLPQPLDQYQVVAGDLLIGRVDFAWPEAMLVVELDGFEFHRDYGPFQDDRSRDRALHAAGWLVLRYTKRDLESTPEIVIAEVRAALIDRGLGLIG